MKKVISISFLVALSQACDKSTKEPPPTVPQKAMSSKVAPAPEPAWLKDAPAIDKFIEDTFAHFEQMGLKRLRESPGFVKESLKSQKAPNSESDSITFRTLEFVDCEIIACYIQDKFTVIRFITNNPKFRFKSKVSIGMHTNDFAKIIGITQAIPTNGSISLDSETQKLNLMAVDGKIQKLELTGHYD